MTLVTERPALEVADIVRAHGDEFRAKFAAILSHAQKKALRDLARCRTAALGGHVERCLDCGHERIAYNSCRNRHCPKCQALTRARWLAAQAEHLLPVEYFHRGVHAARRIGELARANPIDVLRLCCSSRRRRRSAKWPPTRSAWAPCRDCCWCCTPGARTCTIIRTCMASSPAAACRATHREGSMRRRAGCRAGRGSSCRCGCSAACSAASILTACARPIAEANCASSASSWRWPTPPCSHALLHPLYAKDWVVYAKPPFGGPAQVLKYLARYTHRVAISNHRLVKLEAGRVTFRYKDYADEHKQQDDDVASSGVPAPVRAARVAARVREDPALRVAGEPLPSGAAKDESATLVGASGAGDAAGPRRRGSPRHRPAARDVLCEVRQSSAGVQSIAANAGEYIVASRLLVKWVNRNGRRPPGQGACAPC